MSRNATVEFFRHGVVLISFHVRSELSPKSSTQHSHPLHRLHTSALIYGWKHFFLEKQRGRSTLSFIHNTLFTLST